jgi:hypothetical protein
MPKGPEFVKSTSKYDDYTDSNDKITRESNKIEPALQVHYDTTKEIRSYGVSHYKLSLDKEERLKQLTDLKEARNETLQIHQRNVLRKQARENDLQARKRLLLEKSEKRKKLKSIQNEKESSSSGHSSLIKENSNQQDAVDDFLSSL